MGPPGRLRSNPWKPDVLRRLVRRVNAFMLRRLIINRILKLSTKDLLALVSMKNAAKREM